MLLDIYSYTIYVYDAIIYTSIYNIYMYNIVYYVDVRVYDFYRLGGFEWISMDFSAVSLDFEAISVDFMMISGSLQAVGQDLHHDLVQKKARLQNFHMIYLYISQYCIVI